MTINSSRLPSDTRDAVLVQYDVAAPDRRAVSFARSACPAPEAIRAQHAKNHQRAARDGYFIFADVSRDGFSGSRLESVGILTVLDLHISGAMTFTRVYVQDLDRLGRYLDPRMLLWIEGQFARRDVEVVSSSDEGHAPWPPFLFDRLGWARAERDVRGALEKAGLWRAR